MPIACRSLPRPEQRTAQRRGKPPHGGGGFGNSTGGRVGAAPGGGGHFFGIFFDPEAIFVAIVRYSCHVAAHGLIQPIS